MPEYDTINTRFAEAARKYSDRPALSSKPSGSKEWQTLTYSQVAEQVRAVAQGLRALGVGKGDRVAVLSENRPEWAIADLATLAAGGVTVPIYPTLPAAQVAHILSDSGAKAVIAENAKQMAKALRARENSPDLTVFVMLDGGEGKDDIRTLASLIEAGAAHGESYEAVRNSVQPEDLMSLIYTSGTTGNPKGAMLTHHNMVSAVDGAHRAFPITPPEETFLSFLPLSHVFERIVYTLAITIGAHTCYNDSIFKILDNMAELNPTVHVNVPRVFESLHERIEDGVGKLPARKLKLTRWALQVGDGAARLRNAGRRVNPVLAAQFLVADKLVLSKIRARFGSRLKFFVSGGAPLNPKTAHFFNSIGAPILEGWGLTETTAPATVSPYGRAKVGSVGIAVSVAEVKMASDGELLVKGPNVMRGYWNNPEATAEVIDADGWFHTGDIGQIDSEGYVKITDRKKDILVLANGKNVAPQPIETMLKHSPLITEVVLLGDKAGTVSALVVPNFDALKAWAKEQGRDVKKNDELVSDPAARKYVKAEIDRLSKDLADFEKVKRIALLDHAFSVDGGELTPTLKVKRKVVAQKYGALLEKE